MGKIMNLNTTSILLTEKERKLKFSQGIFLDIICFDNVPDNETEKQGFISKTDKLREKAKKLNRLTYRYNPADDNFSLKKVLKVLFKVLYAFFNVTNPCFLHLNRYTQKYNRKNTKEIGSVLYKGKREPPQAKIDYDKSISLPFEFMSINAPNGYENILNRQYGQWKVFEVGTSAHGNLLVDTQKSYKEYLN